MTPDGPVRILLADDHTLVRDGIKLILDAEDDLEVVAEASDGTEAVRRALDEDLELDLAILDVSMPQRTGIQVARELTRRRPELRILLLSMHENEQYLFEALKAGAAGYVLKSSANRDLVAACRSAMQGTPFLYPRAVQTLVQDFLEGAQRGEPLPADLLTAREQEVVKQIAEGHTTDEIAAQLVISPHTVERHRSNVLEKLGLRNRVELARYAIRRGLVEP
jgi:DNA-binding NarL/FixJ family response regulator